MFDRIIKEFNNEYNRRAQLFPAILVIMLPWLLVAAALINNLFNLNLIISLLSTFLLFSIVNIYRFVDVVRNLWKRLEYVLFDKEKNFPTCLFLLREWEFTKEKINEILNKIEKDYHIKLTEELKNKSVEQKKKRISEIVGSIRNRDNMRNSSFLLDSNIRYWFRRNFMWWLIISLFVNIIWFLMPILNKTPNYYFIVLWFSLIVILVLLIFRKKILIWLADQYARQFYIDYLKD